MSKIEIWAPYPYQVVALRGPNKDELVLAEGGPDKDGGGSFFGRLWGVELSDGEPHYYPINSQQLYENCEVIE